MASSHALACAYNKANIYYKAFDISCKVLFYSHLFHYIPTNLKIGCRALVRIMGSKYCAECAVDIHNGEHIMDIDGV